MNLEAIERRKQDKKAYQTKYIGPVPYILSIIKPIIDEYRRGQMNIGLRVNNVEKVS